MTLTVAIAVMTALAAQAPSTSPSSSTSAPAEVALGPLWVRPLALLQIDARAPLHDLGKADDVDVSGVEGEPGFVMPRGRLGLGVRGRGFQLQLIGEGAREKVGLLEAFGVVDVVDGFAVSAGLQRTPLFSGPDPLVTQPISERGVVERTFWPGRELGVTVHAAPGAARLVRPEVWLRVGNGQPNAILGNDNAGFAGDGRVDVVVADVVRVGVGARVEDTDDEPGITGTTPLGFAFWRPPPTSGLRQASEAHALLALGALRALVTGTYAVEGRAEDDDGNPRTPKKSQPSLAAAGAAAELAYTVLGAPRVGGVGAPNLTDTPHLEVALRAERVWLGLPVGDVVDETVVPGGASALTANVTLWAHSAVALSGTVHALAYDVAPLEDPTQQTSLTALARLTFSLR